MCRHVCNEVVDLGHMQWSADQLSLSLSWRECPCMWHPTAKPGEGMCGDFHKNLNIGMWRSTLQCIEKEPVDY